MEIDIRYPCGYGIFFRNSFYCISRHRELLLMKDDIRCPLHGKLCPPQFFGFKSVDELVPKKSKGQNFIIKNFDKVKKDYSKGEIHG